LLGNVSLFKPDLMMSLSWDFTPELYFDRLKLCMPHAVNKAMKGKGKRE